MSKNLQDDKNKGKSGVENVVNTKEHAQEQPHNSHNHAKNDATSARNNKQGNKTQKVKHEGEESTSTQINIDDLKHTLSEIERLEKQCATYEDSLKRVIADKENALKVAKKDVSDARNYSLSEFIKNLVPLCDNLEMASNSVVQGVKIEDIRLGLDMNIKLFMEILKKHGVTRIDSLGVPFDPSVHQAVAEIEDDSKENETVIEIKIPGYMMNGRLIRAAMVVISKKNSKK